MFWGVLVVVATTLLEFCFTILHPSESNMQVWPWSHIWLTLRRLCVMSFTSRTFSALPFLVPILTVPFPIIFALLLFPNMTVPVLFLSRSMNFLLSYVICFEQPLLTHHWSTLSQACKAIEQSSYWWSVPLVKLVHLLLQFSTVCPKLLHLLHSTCLFKVSKRL